MKECQEKIPDGEKKLKKTKELASKTASNSSQNGQEALKRECDHLESDWQDYLTRISQAEDDIKTALVTWGDFETKFTSCSAWLKQMEEQVKNYELKNTLQEKQNQIEKFKVHTPYFFYFVKCMLLHVGLSCIHPVCKHSHVCIFHWPET